MTPDTPIHAVPLFRFSVIWKRKKFIIRSGVYFAVMAFVLFLLMPWQTHYEAMVRIEPELSTTGEVTSIEAEMDVIQSWATVSQAVRQMGRTVNIMPMGSAPLLHLGYYLDWLAGFFSGNPIANFSSYQPSIHLDYFALPENEAPYLNHSFLLEAGKDGAYTLYGPSGKPLLDGKVGEIAKASLDSEGKQELRMLVSAMTARPGNSFSITPVAFDIYTKKLQNALKVERKGFRERSGLMDIGFSSIDPVLAQQFLSVLVNAYVLQAYDRSSLGKIEGLAKLEAQSQILQQQMADAEKTLAEFKDKNQIVDLHQEQEYAYKRSLEVQDELQKTTTKYKELSTSLTDSHPSMVALHQRMDFLQGEADQLKASLESMPQKERQVNDLQSSVTIAKAMLDQNTALAAQLHAEVETITGYAHLISLHLDEKFSPVLRGLLAIILGFATGAMLALSWLIRNTSPAFARVRYAEDLSAVAPLPVVVRLPFQWSGWRWVWYRYRDKNTVSTAQEWVKKSIGEIERLEQEIPILLQPPANKTLLFTSIEDHQGVTFCARQLAIASARTHRTALIDANVMQPGLHHEFLCAPSPGLADILIGRAMLKDALQPTDTPNLSVLPAGNPTPNFRLLSNAERMKALLTELAPMFERIIIEFPVLTPSICQEGVLGTFDAVFVVVNRDAPLRKLAATLESCNVTAHKAAFFVLNKR